MGEGLLAAGDPSGSSAGLCFSHAPSLIWFFQAAQPIGRCLSVVLLLIYICSGKEEATNLVSFRGFWHFWVVYFLSSWACLEDEIFYLGENFYTTFMYVFMYVNLVSVCIECTCVLCMYALAYVHCHVYVHAYGKHTSVFLKWLQSESLFLLTWPLSASAVLCLTLFSWSFVCLFFVNFSNLTRSLWILSLGLKYFQFDFAW